MKPIIVSFLLLSIILIPKFVHAQERKLINFELKDQFDRQYKAQDYRDSFLVLIGSDRDGSKFNARWSKALQEAFKKDSILYNIKLVGFAHLSSVPFFMKGIVKGMFPEEKNKWVLMDWGGQFDKAYNLEADKSNILIFDPKGILIFQTSGTAIQSSEITKATTAILNNK